MEIRISPKNNRNGDSARLKLQKYDARLYFLNIFFDILFFKYLGTIGFDQTYEKEVQREVEIYYCGEQGKFSPLDDVREPETMLRSVLTSRAGGRSFGLMVEKPWETYTVFSYRTLNTEIKQEPSLTVVDQSSQSALSCK